MADKPTTRSAAELADALEPLRLYSLDTVSVPTWLAREAAQALRQQAEALAQFQWRDIATAPKDGTSILIKRANATGISFMYAASWVDYERRSEAGWLPWGDDDVLRDESQPTEWMPLP